MCIKLDGFVTCVQDSHRFYFPNSRNSYFWETETNKLTDTWDCGMVITQANHVPSHIRIFPKGQNELS